MTNGDIIRNFNDEKLAVYIKCLRCQKKRKECSQKGQSRIDCDDWNKFKEWLGEEYKKEE